MQVKLLKYLLSLFLTIISIYVVKSQNNSIASKYYVKEKEILIRWAPSNKQIFDLAVKNGYKITRYNLSGATLSSSIVIAPSIKPYQKNDSLKWIPLLKAKENAILVIKQLYQSQNNLNIPLKQKQEQEIMFYNLVLLSCDFDTDIAKATGLFFKDTTIDNSTNYSYKIEINETPSTTKILPEILSIDASVRSTNPEIKTFSGVFKNKQVKLKWKAIEYKSSYSGYNVERSTDSITYKKINKSPVILLTSQYEKKKEFIFYNDTFPSTKTKYYYRLRGINHFGELSEPSNVISGIGYEALKSMPIIDSIKAIENRKVYIHWRMSDKKENESPKAYILVRANKDSGPYLPIYKSKEYVFIDESPNASNYYKVGAITFHNDTLFSYSYLALILDSIPPSPPKGLKASVDSKGNVSLTWDKNPESDVQGYKVFKANALTEEFVQINNEFARESKYNDKLNLKTLSKKIYYSIVATDKTYNNSSLSIPIEVKRPDTIAPVAPIITDLKTLTNGIKISWILSSSDDVKQYILYRQKENSQTDVKIKEWNAKDSLKFFTDTILEAGEGYRYKIVVSDEDDNLNVSNYPYLKYETGFRKKITDIVFEVDRTLKFISLKWKYDEKGIEKYIIYRSKKGEALTIIKTLAYPTQQLEDKTPNIGNIYEYRIKAVYTNGAESIISDAIRVEY